MSDKHDIVSQLRAADEEWLDEAADEIERLRAALTNIAVRPLDGISPEEKSAYYYEIVAVARNTLAALNPKEKP